MGPVTPVPDPPPDLRNEKRALRTQIAAKRLALAPDAGATVGRRAAKLFLRDPRCAAAERVGLYAALLDEPATRPLFDALRAEGRHVLMPRCIASARLEFAPVDRWDELQAGRYGVPEPVAATWNEQWRRTDVVVVPGLAFDRAGGRLGRGRGYYDHTFDGDRGSLPCLIGFAFAFQIVEEVPMSSLDRQIDGLLTEDGLSWCSGATQAPGE
jgi:5-formyltetrahydrofolate cyclo-ligase